jgi:tRNA A-37 threonylcarbamoyl transferase component Bud32
MTQHRFRIELCEISRPGRRAAELEVALQDDLPRLHISHPSSSITLATASRRTVQISIEELSRCYGIGRSVAAAHRRRIANDDSLTTSSLSGNVSNNFLITFSITRLSSVMSENARGPYKLRHLLALIKVPLSTRIRCSSNKWGSPSV